MKKSLCFLFALVWPAAASAAGWISLGPCGVDALAVVADPRNPAEVYVLNCAATSQIFRSADRGASWVRASVLNDVVYDLIVHPASGALYALADKVVYKSSDRGKTWTSAALDNRDSGFWGALAGHPTNPNLVYAAGLHRPAEGRSHMAFLKSADGGKTWSMTPLQATSDYGYLNKLSVSPKSPDVILAAGYFCDAAHVMRYRLFKSANGGKTWADKTGPIPGLIRDLAAHPTNPKVFYAVTDANVWRTADAAASWKKNKGYARGYSVAVDPARPGVVYAGSDHEVCRSVNGGVDWETAPAGVYGTVKDFAFPGGRVLCGTSAAVFSCADGAWPAWTASSNGMKAAAARMVVVAPSSPNILYAAVFDYGLFRSRNSGAAWELLPGPADGYAASRLAVHPTAPAVVYALSRVWGPDRLSVSTDSGTTWKEVLSADAEDCVLGPRNGSQIYVAGQTASGAGLVMGLHASMDGGATWTHTAASSVAGSCAYAVAVDPKNDAVVYLGGESGGNAALFKSSTRGASWSNIAGALAGRVLDIAVDPKNSKRVYVATESGLWTSESGGASWTKAGSDSTAALLVHPSAPNIVFAATSSGLKISRSYGKTWADYSEGLVDKSLDGLAINATARVLFAATGSVGVWKRKL